MKPKQMSAAERYRATLSTQEAEIVDVRLPSGFVIQMQKPSRFGMLFGMGNMPLAAASRAVEAWQNDGIAAKPDARKGNDVDAEDTLKLFETAIRVRDNVIRLSHSPKLVMGVADETKDEISTDDVSNDDLEYLFNWVSSGGDASAMLGNFPAGSQPGAVAQPNRQARRAKAKQAGGHR